MVFPEGVSLGAPKLFQMSSPTQTTPKRANAVPKPGSTALIDVGLRAGWLRQASEGPPNGPLEDICVRACACVCVEGRENVCVCGGGCGVRTQKNKNNNN